MYFDCEFNVVASDGRVYDVYVEGHRNFEPEEQRYFTDLETIEIINDFGLEILESDNKKLWKELMNEIEERDYSQYTDENNEDDLYA